MAIVNILLPENSNIFESTDRSSTRSSFYCRSQATEGERGERGEGEKKKKNNRKEPLRALKSEELASL